MTKATLDKKDLFEKLETEVCNNNLSYSTNQEAERDREREPTQVVIFLKKKYSGGGLVPQGMAIPRGAASPTKGRGGDLRPRPP